MDVVRTNIEQHRRHASTSTAELGRGTTFSIKIPLTLAIIPRPDRRQRRRALRHPAGQPARAGAPRAPSRSSTGIERIHGAPVYRLRGRLLPLVYLRRELGQPPADATGEPRAVNIVVLQADDRSFGLVVDEHQRHRGDRRQAARARSSRAIATFAGATIMGDGRVALILDVHGLAAAGRACSATPRPRPLIERGRERSATRRPPAAARAGHGPTTAAWPSRSARSPGSRSSPAPSSSASAATRSCSTAARSCRWCA